MRLVVEHLSDMPPLAVLEGHLSAFAGVSGRADALLRRPDLHTVVAYTRTRGMTIESYLDDTLVGRAQIDAVDTDEWCLKHLDGARGMGCDPRIIAETNWLGTLLLGYCLVAFLASDFTRLSGESREKALGYYNLHTRRWSGLMNSLGLLLSRDGYDLTLSKSRPVAA